MNTDPDANSPSEKPPNGKSSEPSPRKGWLRWVVEAISVGTIATILIGILQLLTSWHQIGPDRGYGSCDLKPAEAVNVEEAIAHLRNGVDYESRGKNNFAETEFTQLLKIDPYFIGANLNLGYAYLEQDELDKAEKSFNDELASVQCLNTIPSEQLSKFAYMLNTPYGVIFDSRGNTDYKQRLRYIEDAVHYNLACLHMKQGDIKKAEDQLEVASKNCSISWEKVSRDNDLKPLVEKPPEDLYGWNKCSSEPR